MTKWAILETALEHNLADMVGILTCLAASAT